jgi:hypothetical protein
MKQIKLEDLTRKLSEDSRTSDEIFSFHARNGRWGTSAASAVRINERARTYQQNLDVATARSRFDGEMRYPFSQTQLLNSYLPDFEKTVNRNGFKRSARNAIIGAAFAATLGITALLTDSKVAQTLAEAGSTLSGIYAAYQGAKAYIVYKSPLKFR